MYNVKFHCNYCSDYEIYNRVLEMSPNNSGKWKNINVVNSDVYDVFVIMNYPQYNNYDPKKTIVFESETPSTRNSYPKFYQDRRSEFLYVHDTKEHFNVDLWYHGLTYNELLIDEHFKKTKSLSIINSNLNNLPGHKFRNNLIQQISNTIDFDLFGRFHTHNPKYKGSLNKKSDGLNHYRYTFNCENDFEENYFTEKLLDGIFCECVTFYVGCPNIKQHINPNSFVELGLNIEDNIKIIEEHIKNNVWIDMHSDILEEKRRIMNDYNVLNIVNSILEKV